MDFKWVKNTIATVLHEASSPDEAGWNYVIISTHSDGTCYASVWPEDCHEWAAADINYPSLEAAMADTEAFIRDWHGV